MSLDISRNLFFPTSHKSNRYYIAAITSSKDKVVDIHCISISPPAPSAIKRLVMVTWVQLAGEETTKSNWRSIGPSTYTASGFTNLPLQELSRNEIALEESN
jgi:hypothetical protein